MAIKAGLVGVNPKGVDKNGMPIGSSADSVGEAQLTANGKKFFFAYDETSEKYGYKLDGAGDFIPFESAGGEGLVLPDPSTAGISFTSDQLEIVSGGYQEIDGRMYIDLVFKNNSASNVSATVNGLPHASGSVYALWFINGENKAQITISSSGSTGNQFISGNSEIELICIF